PSWSKTRSELVAGSSFEVCSFVRTSLGKREVEACDTCSKNRDESDAFFHHILPICPFTSFLPLQELVSACFRSNTISMFPPFQELSSCFGPDSVSRVPWNCLVYQLLDSILHSLIFADYEDLIE